MAYLTFDAEHGDRPWQSPENPARILDLLGEAEVKATFFVQGRWASAFPELVRRMHDEGHVIGTHSHYHANMAMFTRQGMDADFGLCEKAIKEATGEWPAKLFRPPFGSHSILLERCTKETGYQTVMWNVDSQDYATDDPKHVQAAILLSKPGQTILLHTWPDSTVKALPNVLWTHDFQGGLGG